LLLRLRIDRVRVKLRHSISFFDALSVNRQNVLIDMAYNMGITGLLKFRKMLAALERGDYEAAAKEMKNSFWAEQVKDRAKTLIEMMRER